MIVSEAEIYFISMADEDSCSLVQAWRHPAPLILWAEVKFAEAVSWKVSRKLNYLIVVVFL